MVILLITVDSITLVAVTLSAELCFLWHPPRTSLRLVKVVIHRLNSLLKLTAPLVYSVVAEYQPEEIQTSENGTWGFPTGKIGT